ncbi:MAG: alpha/beta hydrolase [Acidimicrobiaceae bacterium]|nr:alpha/beta hydrolase [Acidimicrobiaceae bacterium]
MTVDLPGHGGSGQVEVSTLGEAADLLGEVGGPATYLGYSLGGRTCLELALRRPELVQALVLVGATAGIEDPAGRAERRAADEALAGSLEEGGDVALTAFFERWLAGPLFSHLTQEQADMDSRLVNTAAGLAASLRTCGTGTQRPSWDRLGQLAMPVLAVAGEHDERFVRLATRLAAAIGQNASRELVPGAGHAACFERPDAFGALVTSFLTRVGGPA